MRETLFGGRGLIDIEAGGGQLQFDDAAELLFVLDDQNALFHEAGAKISV